MPKKKKKLSKSVISEMLNDILDTDIDFTKLSYAELEELAKAIEKLLKEGKEKKFSLKRLNKLKSLVAELGYEFLTEWDGPVAKVLREIFKSALEGREEDETDDEEEE